MVAGPPEHGRALQDQEARKVRERLVTVMIPRHLARMEALVAPAFAEHGWATGPRLTVADLHLYVYLDWMPTGKVKWLPTTILEPYPALRGCVASVARHPKVEEWNAAH